MTNGQPLSIQYSLYKLALLLAGSAVFVLLGAWLVVGDFSETRRGSLAPFIGCASIFFFGLCGAVALHRLFLGRTTALILTDRGFTYPPFSMADIPWGVVADIRTAAVHRCKFVVVDLLPDVAQSFRRNRLVRFANRGDGRTDNAIYLNANVLNLSHEQLFTTLRDFWSSSKAAEPTIRPAGSKPSAGE